MNNISDIIHHAHHTHTHTSHAHTHITHTHTHTHITRTHTHHAHTHTHTHHTHTSHRCCTWCVQPSWSASPSLPTYNRKVIPRSVAVYHNTMMMSYHNTVMSYYDTVMSYYDTVMSLCELLVCRWPCTLSRMRGHAFLWLWSVGTLRYLLTQLYRI